MVNVFKHLPSVTTLFLSANTVNDVKALDILSYDENKQQNSDC